MDDVTNKHDQLQAPLADKMVSVIEIKAWIAFGIIIIMLVAALAWGFLGTMRSQMDVRGVIVRSGRIFHIYATDDTILLDFNLQPNQIVERDQVVARLDRSALVREINLMIDQGASSLEVESKRMELIASSQILTHYPGRVVDVFAARGDFIRRGDRLATISSEPIGGSGLETLLFVPVSDAMRIRKGMAVNVFPASVNRREFGNMEGHVVSVSDYPVTFLNLVDKLGSEELAHEFLADGAVHLVRVLLIASEYTATGYAWTTSLGPNLQFSNLTMTDATVILAELSPIEVFFLE
jgi:hypothetical protein